MKDHRPIGIHTHIFTPTLRAALVRWKDTMPIPISIGIFECFPHLMQKVTPVVSDAITAIAVLTGCCVPIPVHAAAAILGYRNPVLEIPNHDSLQPSPRHAHGTDASKVISAVRLCTHTAKQPASQPYPVAVLHSRISVSRRSGIGCR